MGTVYRPHLSLRRLLQFWTVSFMSQQWIWASMDRLDNHMAFKDTQRLNYSERTRTSQLTIKDRERLRSLCSSASHKRRISSPAEPTKVRVEVSNKEDNSEKLNLAEVENVLQEVQAQVASSTLMIHPSSRRCYRVRRLGSLNSILHR